MPITLLVIFSSYVICVSSIYSFLGSFQFPLCQICKNQPESLFACGADKGILHCPQFVIGKKIAVHCAQAHKVQFYQDIFRLPNALQNSDMLGILHGIISHTFSPDVRGLLEHCMTNQGSGKWAMISLPGFLE